jgi:hypothetical protein
VCRVPHPLDGTISSFGLDLDTTRLHQKDNATMERPFFLILLLDVAECRGEENAERVKGK